MIRLSFNKIEISQSTVASHVLLEVEIQNSKTLKLKPKKIKNRLARFYGDFIELENNIMNLKLKIYKIEQENTQIIVQRIVIKGNTYGYSEKKTHFIQTIKLKIWFESENLKDSDSVLDQTRQENNFVEKGLISQRMGLMKALRGFSPDQRFIIQRHLSTGCFKNVGAKNSTMGIFVKSPFKDMKLIKM